MWHLEGKMPSHIKQSPFQVGFALSIQAGSSSYREFHKLQNVFLAREQLFLTNG